MPILVLTPGLSPKSVRSPFCRAIDGRPRSPGYCPRVGHRVGCRGALSYSPSPEKLTILFSPENRKQAGMDGDRTRLGVLEFALEIGTIPGDTGIRGLLEWVRRSGMENDRYLKRIPRVVRRQRSGYTGRVEQNSNPGTTVDAR